MWTNGINNNTNTNKYMKLKTLYILAILFFVTTSNYGQDTSLSPYAFFGIGDPAFKGNVENVGMGGVNVYGDSIHYNINHIASLSELKFVNFNLGMSNNFVQMTDPTQEKWASTHNVSYFSLGIPIGKKFGFGFGLLPVSSAGYKIYNKTDDGNYTYDAKGGLNRFFFAGAYSINKDIHIGLAYNYHFGFLTHNNYWIPNNTITYTRDENSVAMKGSTFKFSADYKYHISKKNYLKFNLDYRLESNLKSDFVGSTRLVTSVSGYETTVEILNKDDKTADITLPSELDLGIGIGKKNTWFLGAEYDYIGMKNFNNPFYDPSYVQYKDAFHLKFGGMFIPEYNSITNYWKRVTYRAGLNYKQTGMNIYGADINDFGITFGLGLPLPRKVSNLNIGLELGQRGKATTNLVKEKYVNLHISLSLNDRWFIKRKIN